MKRIKKLQGTPADANRQLRDFIARFTPERQKLIRALRRKLRKRLPTAHELVYDNYNFLVIGYSATERASGAIISLAAGASGVNLFFLWGARLPDPGQMLLGAGKQVRFIRTDTASVLEQTAVKALLTAAIERANTPLNARGKGKLLVKSIASKQRPRR